MDLILPILCRTSFSKCTKWPPVKNLVLVRIWKKINNDKRRKDMVVGKVVAHLCLTLIIWKETNTD